MPVVIWLCYALPGKAGFGPYHIVEDYFVLDRLSCIGRTQSPFDLATDVATGFGKVPSILIGTKSHERTICRYPPTLQGRPQWGIAITFKLVICDYNFLQSKSLNSLSTSDKRDLEVLCKVSVDDVDQ